MRMLLGAVAMTALMGAASAYAATATGRITDINAAKDTVTLTPEGRWGACCKC